MFFCQVLRIGVGDTLRVGVIDVGITDNGSITHQNITHITICIGEKVFLVPGKSPRIDIILAVPRPLRLERILPVLSSMGVGSITLIGASKVEKDYFGKVLMIISLNVHICNIRLSFIP